MSHIQPQNILIAHLSGNTGKTTIARHLVHPRMGADARLISVETINADGEEGQVIRGKQFALLQQAVLSGIRVVADVGASNIEAFLQQMRQYTGSHDDFDLILVPVVAATKQMKDTVATIEELASLGVPADKIRLVFNAIEPDMVLSEAFAPLFSYAEKGTFVLNPAVCVPQSDLLARLKGSDKTIAQLAADETNYRSLISGTEDPEARLRYADALASVRLARGLQPRLDAAFAALTAA